MATKEEKARSVEQLKNLLRENPNISNGLAAAMTGLTNTTINRYRREFGIARQRNSKAAQKFPVAPETTSVNQLLAQNWNKSFVWGN